jgi:hypothetical protein
MDISLKHDRISHPQWLALQIILILPAVFFISLTRTRNALSSNQSQNKSDNPAPVLTAIVPAQVALASEAFTLTITGSKFTPQSVLLKNSTSKALVILPRNQVFLPLALRHFPPATDAPKLQPIANADYDNRYTVSWRNSGTGNSYVLEESLDPAFTEPLVVYQGPNLSWAVPPEGKLPGTYYYRVRTSTPSGESPWSSDQSVRVYPLFVGLKARYEGMGSVRSSNSYEIGWYETITLDALKGVDSVQAQIHAWYDPNPHGFEESYKTSYFSVLKGDLISGTDQSDPAWKWEYTWKLAYDVNFTDGSTFQIDGQNFTVSGPKDGTTSYGRSITYWEFVNQDQFLIYDSGDVKQVTQPGEVILRYDAGASRLLIHNNITRHIYYQGEDIGESIQYLAHLAAANSLPASPPAMLRAGDVEALSVESH